MSITHREKSCKEVFINYFKLNNCHIRRRCLYVRNYDDFLDVGKIFNTLFYKLLNLKKVYFFDGDELILTVFISKDSGLFKKMVNKKIEANFTYDSFGDKATEIKVKYKPNSSSSFFDRDDFGNIFYGPSKTIKNTYNEERTCIRKTVLAEDYGTYSDEWFDKYGNRIIYKYKIKNIKFNKFISDINFLLFYKYKASKFYRFYKYL